ncbi:MAG: hypothetical protein KDJ12_01965, partial [Hyphomicrobiales bacterium]|nr:hypothetical protein [Hyphomicrobiales bacterium]
RASVRAARVLEPPGEVKGAIQAPAKPEFRASNSVITAAQFDCAAVLFVCDCFRDVAASILSAPAELTDPTTLRNYAL